MRAGRRLGSTFESPETNNGSLLDRDTGLRFASRGLGRGREILPLYWGHSVVVKTGCSRFGKVQWFNGFWI